MNTKIIFKTMAAALLLPVMAACSGDYLDEAPQTEISAETVNSSEKGAIAALTGLAMQMQRQFDDLKNGNLNASGELFFKNLYGEGLGCDANVGEIINYASSSTSPMNMRTMSGQSWWASWMYNYCYSIIGSANKILSNLEGDNLSNTEIWLKACALTFRSHAYYHLMQVYGPRWADAKNGEELALVFRIKAGEPNEHPLDNCNTIYNQLYEDLNLAIDLFGKTDVKRESNMYYPDVTVAQGTLARIALLKDDYKTAQAMAHAARQPYKIMTATQYLEGFSVTNDEWMWAPAMDPLGTYYWGFGPHYACNGHYTISWGYSSSMDYNLYKHLKITDVRAKLYFGPLTIDMVPEMAAKYGITKESFFSKSQYKQTNLGVSITSTGKTPTGVYKNMYEFIMEYGKTFNDLRPEDIKGIYTNNNKGFSMGIQYKFQGLADGYTSCWPPYMRAAEMLLTEAEAAYQNNDMTTAQNCLKELMAQRDETYTLPATSGTALLDEIKLQRRIELWGEGFCWFDFKRWNQTMSRKAWNPEDLDNCGGWPSTLARDFAPDFMYGWRCAIPQNEFTYNKEANQALIGL